MLAPEHAAPVASDDFECDRSQALPSPAASHCSSSVGSAPAKDPAALKDALRRMERTMVGRKSHHLAEEARRWGRHVPTLANSNVQEVGEILERLARFRELHASRVGLRRKIGAELGPGPMPPLTRPTRREVRHGRARAGVEPVMAAALAGSSSETTSVRRAADEEALTEQLESMNLVRRPQLA